LVAFSSRMRRRCTFLNTDQTGTRFGVIGKSDVMDIPCRVK
jgi:hypothetical protein